MSHLVPVDRQQIIKDSAKYLVATITAQGVGIIRGLVIPVLFIPAQLGIWNLMGVIVSYGTIAHLGMLNGMNKAIPFLRGQGKLEQAEVIRDSVFWVNMLLGALAGSTILIVSLFAPVNYRSSLCIIGAIVFLQLIFLYMFSLLRADNRFGLLSQGTSGLSILSTILVCTLALTFGNHLFGALVGWAGAHLLIVGYMLVKARYRFAFRISLPHIRETFSLGVPLIILAVLDVIFLSVDRWMIVTNLGETILGYYALGLMVNSMIFLIPTAVATVLFPRQLERFGTTSDPHSIQSLLLGPLRAMVALMLVLVCGVTLGLPLVIRLFLAKYLPSVPIIKILIIGAFFYSLASIPGNCAVAINKQKKLILVLIGAILFSLLMDTILLWAGYGVMGIAIGTMAGYFFYGMGHIIIGLYGVLEQKSEVARFLTRLLIPFPITVFTIVAADFLVREGATVQGYILATLIKTALVASVLLPILWLTNRDGEVIGVVRKELKSWLATKNGRA